MPLSNCLGKIEKTSVVDFMIKGGKKELVNIFGNSIMSYKSETILLIFLVLVLNTLNILFKPT